MLESLVAPFHRRRAAPEASIRTCCHCSPPLQCAACWIVDDSHKALYIRLCSYTCTMHMFYISTRRLYLDQIPRETYDKLFFSNLRSCSYQHDHEKKHYASLSNLIRMTEDPIVQYYHVIINIPSLFSLSDPATN